MNKGTEVAGVTISRNNLVTNAYMDTRVNVGANAMLRTTKTGAPVEL